MIAGVTLKNISVRESHAIVIRNVGRIGLSRKLWQMFSNWMLQSKEFNTKKFNTSAITISQHASKQELLGEITEILAHQSPPGNMHKLLDCIKTSLKRFLPCLGLHRKEIRLCHLDKRTNPGSAPEILNHQY